MSFIDRDCTQTVTWWARQSIDQFGDPSFAAPIALAHASGNGVRWQSRSEKFINPNGDEEQSRAVVWSATHAFGVGDYLYLGSSVVVNPESVDDADQVRQAEEFPDIRNRKTLYKVFL